MRTTVSLLSSSLALALSIPSTVEPSILSPLSDEATELASASPEVRALVTGVRDSLLNTNATGHDRAPWVQPGNEIVFGMLSGHEVLMDRAWPKLQTWCVDAGRACVVFSDEEDEKVKPWVIHLGSMGFKDEFLAAADKYVVAQKRFLPALHCMQELVTMNYRGRFARTKWVMLVDDDTYVFWPGLQRTLQVLPDPWKNKIYTGEPAPARWFGGNGLAATGGPQGRINGKPDTTPFILGGGGSLFSISAIKSLNLYSCIDSTLPGGQWEEYQSDWVLGTCAERHGIRVSALVSQPFNQFVCTEPSEKKLRYCESTDPKDQTWDKINHIDDEGALFDYPATLHPVKDSQTTYYVREALRRAEQFPTAGTLAAFRDMMSSHLDLDTYWRNGTIVARGEGGAIGGQPLALSSTLGGEQQQHTVFPRSLAEYCTSCPPPFVSCALADDDRASNGVALGKARMTLCQTPCHNPNGCHNDNA